MDENNTPPEETAPPSADASGGVEARRAPIDEAARQQLRAALVVELQNKGQWAPQELPETTLAGMMAGFGGREEALALWMKYGNALDPNAFDRYSHTTPLAMAVRWNNAGMAWHLLRQGADPRKTPGARSPLKEAAAHTNKELTALLLERLHWSVADLSEAVVAAAESYCEQTNPVILLLAETMADRVRQGRMTRESYQGVLRQALCTTTGLWHRAKPLTSRLFRLSPHQTLMRVLFLAALGAQTRGLLDDDMMERGSGDHIWTVSVFARSLPTVERELLEYALTQEDVVLDRIRRADVFLTAPIRAVGVGQGPARSVDVDDIDTTVRQRSARGRWTVRDTKTNHLGKIINEAFLGSAMASDREIDERAGHTRGRLIQASDLEQLPVILDRIEALCVDDIQAPAVSAVAVWNADHRNLGRDVYPNHGIFCLDPGPDDGASTDERLQQLRDGYLGVRRRSLLATYGPDERRDIITTLVIAAVAGMDVWPEESQQDDMLSRDENDNLFDRPGVDL